MEEQNLHYNMEEQNMQECLMNLLEDDNELSERFQVLEQRCNQQIESLKEQIKRPRLSIGERQSQIAQLMRFEGLKNLIPERFVHANAGCSAQNRLVWREVDTAFKSRILTGAVINNNHIEPRQFLEDAKDIVIEHVQDALKKHNCVKVNTIFNGKFVTGDKHDNKNINTRNYELFRMSDLSEWYERDVIELTLAKLEEFQQHESGWALSKILNLNVNINKYNPMCAGCYIELPEKIKKKKAVISVKSKDNMCFAWAVVAALYPVKKNVERESSYPNYATVLNLQDIEFPVTVNQIKKFELVNDFVSINVYGIENEGIVPLRLTEQKRDKHVNLLYVRYTEDDNNVGHFAWIKNLSRLVSSQLSKHNGRKYICDRCLHYFSSDDKLQSHTIDCGKMNNCAVRLPSDKDKWLSFNNFNRKERLPFVVYADLESVQAKTKEENNAYRHHQAFSLAYYVHCSFDESLSEYYSRRNIDCITWFVEDLKNLAIRVKNILSTNVPIDLTTEEWEKLYSATQCHICKKPFAEDDKPVRDHCHLTGRYRGPAHSNCNLNYKQSYCIPIVFHNLSGYDSHFIIEKIATVRKNSQRSKGESIYFQ